MDETLETLGRIKHARQARLAELGFALPAGGVRDGWIAIEHGGTPLGIADGTRSFMRTRLAPYIATAALPVKDADDGEAALERIAAALIAHAGMTPDQIHRIKADVTRVPLPPLRHGDGRLAPTEWVRLADGRILKRDATGTDCDHSWTGSQSVLWDVGGAAVECNMTAHDLARFLAELEVLKIRAEPLALAFHRAGYCCSQLAWARHKGDGPRAAWLESRLAAALRELEASC